MKKLLLLLIGISAMHQAHAQSGNAKDIATQFLQHLNTGNYDEAFASIDAEKTKLTKEKLSTTWAKVAKQLGGLDSMGEVSAEKFKEGEIVHIIANFRNGKFDFQVTIAADKKITGFFLVAPKPKAQWKAPDYISSKNFTEKSINLHSGKYDLPAILTLPNTKGKCALIILVHGSGAHDMDESIGPNKPFKELAEGLSSKGIAVLRYNKRTYVAHDLDSNITLKEEVVDDALEAIKLAAQFPEIDGKRIYVLGHSLGGMVAPWIAKDAKNLAGIILFAAPARPMDELLLEQYKYLIGLQPQSAEGKAEIEKIEKAVALVRGKDFNINTPAAKLPLGMPAAYWLSLNKYKQVTVAEKLSCKILVMQGQRDYNVTIDDYDFWRLKLGNNKKVSFKLYDKLNHLFHEGVGKATPQELEEANHIPEYVIDH
ncbi:MAG: alpha/beta fold hydrolase [Bacteroidetes bacterium]|nr:alpha/beta fold hydrolase [Bacteroidota bacterium]